MGFHRRPVPRAELLVVTAIALVSSAAGCGGESTRSNGSPGGGNSGGGVVAFGDPTPMFTPLEAARACILTAACLRDPPTNWTAGACVYNVERSQVMGTRTLIGFAKCAARAASCTEAFECVSLGHGPEYCSAHVEPSCDGDLFVSCPRATDWADYVFDCSAAGMKCVDGHCTDGNTCKGPVVLSCRGNSLASCDLLSENQASTDCGTVYPGGRCVPLPGGPECLPAEKETCDSVGFYTCSGNVLLGCDGPRKSKLDCGALESDCGATATSSDCVPRAHECTYESPDQCHGAALSICIDGHYQDVDCGSLGLGPCQTIPTGVACGSSPKP